jgi:hypothetical protein
MDSGLIDIRGRRGMPHYAAADTTLTRIRKAASQVTSGTDVRQRPMPCSFCPVFGEAK